ncbi:MAG: hypothetical protein ACR2PT_11840 [Endozoicomonas sp.]
MVNIMQNACIGTVKAIFISSYLAITATLLFLFAESSIVYALEGGRAVNEDICHYLSDIQGIRRAVYLAPLSDLENVKPGSGLVLGKNNSSSSGTNNGTTFSLDFSPECKRITTDCSLVPGEMNPGDFWQDDALLTPRLEVIDHAKLPPLQHVSMVVSGGTPKPFSQLVKQNHLVWAYSRQVRYAYYELDQKLVTQTRPENGSTDYWAFPAGYSDSIPVLPTVAEVLHALGEKQPYWAKVAILKQHLEAGTVPEDKWIAWLDNDITTSDFRAGISMLDRAIEDFGEGKSLLVTKDGVVSNSPLNTGIILLRNDPVGRALIQSLWGMSDDPVMGYMAQPYSFHEQQALKEIYEGNVDVSSWWPHLIEEYSFYEPKALQAAIKVVPVRRGSFNMNTWVCDNQVLPCWALDRNVIAIRGEDAFIHHPAMGDRKKPEIEITLDSIWEHYPLQKRFAHLGLYRMLPRGSIIRPEGWGGEDGKIVANFDEWDEWVFKAPLQMNVHD